MVGGRLHVEVMEHRPGVAWMGERIVELQRRWRPAAWLLDPASPAGSLLLDLAAAGIAVDPVDARRYAQACGQLYDAVAERTLEHRGQPALDAAVAGARRRTLGERVGVGSARNADVCPLVAVTLAAYGLSATAGQRGKAQIL